MILRSLYSCCMQTHTSCLCSATQDQRHLDSCIPRRQHSKYRHVNSRHCCSRIDYCLQPTPYISHRLSIHHWIALVYVKPTCCNGFTNRNIRNTLLTHLPSSICLSAIFLFFSQAVFLKQSLFRYSPTISHKASINQSAHRYYTRLDKDRKQTEDRPASENNVCLMIQN